MTQLRRGWNESPSLRALRSATEAASRVRPSVARRAGLSQSELVALEHLSRAPVGPGQLARLLGVTTAASTGVVDRLVSRGHATRDPRPDDRRRTDVRLTVSGRREVRVRLMPMFTALQALDDTFLGRRQIPGVREQHGHPLVAGQLGKPVEQSALADSARSIHPEQCRLPRTVEQLIKDGDLGIPADEAASDVLAEAVA